MKANARVLVLGTLLGVAVPAVIASAQSDDPIMGTWVLNVSKSTYSIGPAPRSLTRTYTAAPNGYKFVSRGVDAEGKPVLTEFTAAYDGKYYPSTGNPNVDSIMVKRIDANTAEATQTKAGKVVIRTTRVVSRDGKTITSTATGTNSEGKSFKNVEVFEKR